MKITNSNKKKLLSSEQCEKLLNILESRLEKNMNRHKGLEWAKVQSAICRRVGQVLNNAWRVDDEILYKGNQKRKMACYMIICCGLLEPYLTEQSAGEYRHFFKNL